MFKLFFFQEPSPVPKRNTMAMLQGNTMILNHLPYPENPTWLPGKSRSWSLMYRLCSLFFPLKPPFMGRMFARGEGQGSSYGAHSVGTWRWWRRDAKLWIVLFFLFFFGSWDFVWILLGAFRYGSLAISWQMMFSCQRWPCIKHFCWLWVTVCMAAWVKASVSICANCICTHLYSLYPMKLCSENIPISVCSCLGWSCNQQTHVCIVPPCHICHWRSPRFLRTSQKVPAACEAAEVRRHGHEVFMMSSGARWQRLNPYNRKYPEVVGCHFLNWNAAT